MDGNNKKLRQLITYKTSKIMSKTKRLRSSNLNIRLTKEEVLRLKLKAEVQGVTVSKLIRQSI